MRTARLTLQRWCYDILTGRIEEYDKGKKRFFPLAG
jgi:carbonic anhydrase